MANQQEVVLLTGSDDTRRALQAQLEEIIGDVARMRSYAAEEGDIPFIERGIVLLSSGQLAQEVQGALGPECTLVIAERAINFHHIDQLFELEEGLDVLYVNDSPENVQRAIESLRSLGIDHLNYHPWYPGKTHAKRCRVAITPGEPGLVPDWVTQIVDIGPRLIDVTSIIALLNALGLDIATQRILSDRYIQKIIDLSKRIAKVSREARHVSAHLKQVVDGVHDGILAVNPEGVITVFNGILEDILDVQGGRAIGRHLDDIIHIPELVQFINDDQAESARYFTLANAEIMVHRLTLDSDHSRVATFKNAGETLEMERKRRQALMRKGHYAKYTFNDIVGHSTELQNTKRIAHKLAQSDLTILIEGESGTGKELFASSIHHASPRHNGPFLAVNFSALPEDLVESELFGHDEGAFTGARKGGRKGLFEQAHGGTLFLDEIGDISLKVQARLLRVLQEKELIRVGGTDVIPVDVRIIAATNRHLLTRVEDNLFREDLYHRLKVLYLHLPPLRQRAEDIEELIRYTIHQAGRQDIFINPAVITALRAYPWYGNIRELRNTLDYMLAVCEDNELQLRDIPAPGFFQATPIGLSSTDTSQRESVVDHQHNAPPFATTASASPATVPSAIPQHELDTLLQLAQSLQQQEGRISRVKLAVCAQQAGHSFTEQQIRLRMNLLQDQGLVIQFRGRTGTRLTEAGQAHVKALRACAPTPPPLG